MKRISIRPMLLLVAALTISVVGEAQTWKKVSVGSGGTGAAPTITLTTPPNTWVSATANSFTLTATYSASTNPATISLGPSFITITGSGVSCNVTVNGSSGLTRTITVSACTGDSTTSQVVIAPGSAASAGGTAAEGVNSAVFKVDNTPPVGWNPTYSPSTTNYFNFSGVVTFTAPTDAGSGMGTSYTAQFIGTGATSNTSNPNFSASGTTINGTFTSHYSCSGSYSVNLSAIDLAGNKATVNRAGSSYNGCD